MTARFRISAEARHLKRQYEAQGDMDVSVIDRLTPDHEEAGNREYEFPSPLDHEYWDDDVFEAMNSHTGNLDHEDIDPDEESNLSVPSSPTQPGPPSSSTFDEDFPADDDYWDDDTENIGLPPDPPITAHASSCLPSPPPSTLSLLATTVGEAAADSDGVFFDDQHHARCKRCTVCNKVIKLGSGKTMHAYTSHVNSGACIEESRKYTANRKQRKLDEMFVRKPRVQPSLPRSSADKHLDLSRPSPVPPMSTSGTVVDDLTGDTSSSEDEDSLVSGKITALLTSQGLCPGIKLNFPGPTWRTYPFQLHAFEKVSFTPAYWGPNGDLYVYSKSCQRAAKSRGRPCSECASVNTSSHAQQLQKRATQCTPTTLNWRYYNFDQITELLKNKNDEKNQLKLKTLADARRYHTATARLNDHERLLTALSDPDAEFVAGRIAQVALNNNKSPREIIRRIENAVRGVYHPKSFQEKHYEIMRVIMILGGPKAVYAVSHALNLPSISTIKAHAQTPEIYPCIGFPTRFEIQHNFSALHKAQVLACESDNHRASKRGFALMIDELALEERPRYDSVRDALLGIAREDASSCDLTTITLDTLYAAADALQDGTLSFAKEATVVAIAAFDTNQYTPFPVMISGTNKSETQAGQSAWIELVINVWDQSEHGESLYGPLWSVGSDGDATRRKALHKILMCETLSSSGDELYDILGCLPRMNLQCGKKARTLTIDYKHKFKNFASVLRSRKGLIVADFHVTGIWLRSAFSTYLNFDECRLTRLFNHRDHQNVPNAIELLMAVKHLSEVPEFQAHVDSNPIRLLGQFISFLVDPFKTPSMSLAEQLSSLSAAAHLLFVIYRRNRTGFCPGQWFYDVQSFIKSIFWNVAKQKLLDSEANFHITQDGTDCLEGNFGTYRDMDSSHNVDILQLSQRAGLTAELGQIFAKNPSWDRGHRRLRLEGVEGVDHTNPHSWTGDVRVSTVSILTSWNSGWRQARDLLRRLDIDFEDLVTLPENVDLLRPFGEYVGLHEDYDICEELAIEEPDWDNIEVSQQAVASNASIEDPDWCHTVLDDVLPNPTERHDPDSAQKNDRNWLLVNNKPMHKASAIRWLLATSEGRKSTDRTSRVQGLLKIRTYSREPSGPTLQDDSIIGAKFLVNDLVASYLRIKDDVALAIIRVSEIQNPSRTSVSSIGLKYMQSPEVILTGQVLKLTANSESTWIWTGEYESFNASGDASVANRAASKKSMVVQLPASLTEVVKARLARNEDLSLGSETRFIRTFDSSTLHALTNILWDRVKGNEKKLPARSETKTFPCRNDQGDYMFVNAEGTATMQAGPKDGIFDCFICNKEIPGKEMRCHVGGHIMRTRLHLPEAGSSPNYTIGSQPCGFCGRSNTCSIGLGKPAKTLVPVSNCPYFTKFSLASAAKTTTTGACTNRPMVCELCLSQEPVKKRAKINNAHVFWSYNLTVHVTDKHGVAAAVAGDFADKFSISHAELVNMKLVQPRDTKEQQSGSNKRRNPTESNSKQPKRVRMGSE